MFDSPTALGPEEPEAEPAPEPASEPAPGMALEIAEGDDEEEFSDRCARIPCVDFQRTSSLSALLVAASGTRRVPGTR